MPRSWIPSVRAVQSPRHLWTSRTALLNGLIPRACLGAPRHAVSPRFAHAAASAPPHLLDRVLLHAHRPALYDANVSAPWTYAQLLDEAAQLSDAIRQALPLSADAHPRVAYLGSRGPSYVAIQWATWLAGGVAVPLHPAHPTEELEYILSDSAASVLIVSDEFFDAPIGAWIRGLEASGSLAVLPYARPTQRDARERQLASENAVLAWHTRDGGGRDHGAHIVYTSGTTGRPKGVVTTHAGLTAQTLDVMRAWEMTADDHLLHFLPLHHVHGILNNLLCVHYAGGSLEFLPSAKPALVWRKLVETERPVTMLMAVPTVYMNLLEAIEAHNDDASFDKEMAVAAARHLRVAISGSMACPVSILDRWERLTGLRLLERYGMTELGMALTNPLHGERHLGYVGQPFPSVRVRLVDPDTDEEVPLESEHEGELRVKGPTVFQEYWRKPEATAKEFDTDGWFKTGDIAQYDKSKASFRIRGRASADIIKSGGYKISALDIERVLLTHPQVQECAVFGIADEKWGQIVSAVLRVKAPEHKETMDQEIKTFCLSHLADYRVPRKLFFVDEIPKNAMGKVNKKALATLFGAK